MLKENERFLVEEKRLRENVLAKLRLEDYDIVTLFAPFMNRIPNCNTLEIYELYKSLITKAVASGHWGCGDEVNIGVFNKESQYYNLLLHEATHGVINHYYPERKKKGSNFDWEEEFCYEMSRRICRHCALPYSKKIEFISREFDCLIHQLSDNRKNPSKIINKLDLLAQTTEAKILGFDLKDQL